MRDEIKAQRLAEMFGLDVPENLKIPEKVDESELFKSQMIRREAEAILAYVEDSRKFVQKECKNCGGVFVANRQDVGYCCDHCRIAALAQMGISWDPSKNPEERWDFRLPLVVPPLLLERLQPIVDHIEILKVEAVEQQEQERRTVEKDQLDQMLVELGLE